MSVLGLLVTAIYLRQLCSQDLMHRNMVQKEILSSDATMAASIAFNKILQQVQSSSVNFQLQLSPFSAVISLKKSLVKDKAGCYLLPSASSDTDCDSKFMALTKKIHQLESESESLNCNFENALQDSENAYKTIRNLEHKLNISKQTNDKIKTETTEHDSLNDDLRDKTNHIHCLEMKNAELVDLLNFEAQKLNNELSQN